MRKQRPVPDGGGHKTLGRQASRAHRNNMGFDYIHSAVDDHTRLAYSEIHPDEKAATCAAFLCRAAAFSTTCGITRIERVLTDNAWPCRPSFARRGTVVSSGRLRRLVTPEEEQGALLSLLEGSDLPLDALMAPPRCAVGDPYHHQNFRAPSRGCARQQPNLEAAAR